MEQIHIGETIKQILDQRGISVSEFAKRINKSRENVYSIFNRKSIDTSLLMTISKALDYDFFKLYCFSFTELELIIAKQNEEIMLLKELNELLRKKSK